MEALACRRMAVAAIILVTTATQGATQEASSKLFDDFSRYVGAAVRFVADAIQGIERVEASQIAPSDRVTTIDQLRGISVQLSKLTVAPGAVLADLSEYTRRIRAQGVQPDRDAPAWRAVLAEFDSVSEVIKETLKTVEGGSKWLTVALSADDRLTLREALFARNDLITRFKKMPFPRSPAELDQIDRMAGDYQKLLQSIREMNLAITRLTDRLAAE
jgi:hypothetical protein